MKKILLFLTFLCFSAAHAMETKQPNATSQVKLLENALNGFAYKKLSDLAQNSPELFMCLVAHARKTDKELQVYRDDSHATSELYKLGMVIEIRARVIYEFVVHPTYAQALETLIQELLSEQLSTAHNS